MAHEPDPAALVDAQHLSSGGVPAGDVELLARIEHALAAVQPMAEAGWEQAASIGRQLRWCRDMLRGDDVEPAPGPFSMGLIATREFDMYGSQPQLAALINDIEHEMRRRGSP